MGEILEENIRSNVDTLLLAEQIEKLLGTLSEREASVIRLRTMQGMTLDQVGNVLGVGRERIRQIENKCLRKLRHPSRTKILEEWLSDKRQEERKKNRDEEEKATRLIPQTYLDGGREWRESLEKQKKEEAKLWKNRPRPAWISLEKWGNNYYLGMPFEMGGQLKGLEQETYMKWLNELIAEKGAK